MVEVSDIKTQVAKLIEERNRRGKERWSDDEKVARLWRVYEGLLALWEQCIITGHINKIGTIRTQMEGARLEIESITRTGEPVADTDYDLPQYDETYCNNWNLDWISKSWQETGNWKAKSTPS